MRRSIKPANERNHNYSYQCECVYLPRIRKQTLSLLMLYMWLGKYRLRPTYHSHLCLTLSRVCYYHIIAQIITSVLVKSLDTTLNTWWEPEAIYTKCRTYRTLQMALAVSFTCLHTFFHFFYALALIHLVLLARFVAQISTSFSVLVPRMCVLYHNFYCIFSCYFSLN
jgi:hypothetical protein